MVAGFLIICHQFVIEVRQHEAARGRRHRHEMAPDGHGCQHERRLAVNRTSAAEASHTPGRRFPTSEPSDATAERWQQVHELRAQNVGLLDCARRLNLSLNTIKRYARASEPERLQRVRNPCRPPP